MNCSVGLKYILNSFPTILFNSDFYSDIFNRLYFSGSRQNSSYPKRYSQTENLEILDLQFNFLELATLFEPAGL